MKFSWNNKLKMKNPLFLLLELIVCSSSLSIQANKLPTSTNSHDGAGTDFTTNKTFSLESDSVIYLSSTPSSPTKEEVAPFPSTPAKKHRQRATKVLESPLESQLFKFQERGNNEARVEIVNDRENFLAENLSSLSSSLRQSSGNTMTLSPSSSFPSHPKISQEVPVIRVSGVQRRGKLPISIVRKRILKAKEPTRRQEDISSISLTNEVPPAAAETPVEFPFPVSPLEASLGGLTGLQGLPPLSFVQFVKLLVAITPFIIPMIFVPLLIFSIGILMIPVTRGNVFVDVGDLRRSASHVETGNQSQSFIANYFVSPMKKFTGSVMMPRAYQLANEFIDHEQCVERISCEISARYLQHTEWNGSWKSMANKSWISRIISYLGENRPTLLRIAKSLYWNPQEDSEKKEAETITGRSVTEKQNENLTKDERAKDENSESGGYRETNMRKENGEHERHFINESTCRKFVCQPNGFLRRLFS